MLLINPEIPVGGRLKNFVNNWEQITTDQWVLSIIRDGYKMEFQNIPKFNGIIQTKLSQNNMSILQQEIDSLLKKRQ